MTHSQLRRNEDRKYNKMMTPYPGYHEFEMEPEVRMMMKDNNKIRPHMRHVINLANHHANKEFISKYKNNAPLIGVYHNQNYINLPNFAKQNPDVTERIARFALLARLHLVPISERMTVKDVMSQEAAVTWNDIIVKISSGTYGQVFELSPDYPEALSTILQQMHLYGKERKFSSLVSRENLSGKSTNLANTMRKNFRRVFLKVQLISDQNAQQQYVKEDIIFRHMMDLRDDIELDIRGQFLGSTGEATGEDINLIPGKGTRHQMLSCAGKITPFKGVRSQFPKFLMAADLLMKSLSDSIIPPVRVTVMEGLEVKETMSAWFDRYKVLIEQSQGKVPDKMKDEFAVVYVYLEKAILALWLNGIFHGDAHARNVLLCNQNITIGSKQHTFLIPHIIDFGLSKVLSLETVQSLKTLVTRQYLTPNGIDYNGEVMKKIMDPIIREYSHNLAHSPYFYSDLQLMRHMMAFYKKYGLEKYIWNAKLYMIQEQCRMGDGSRHQLSAPSQRSIRITPTTRRQNLQSEPLNSKSNMNENLTGFQNRPRNYEIKSYPRITKYY